MKCGKEGDCKVYNEKRLDSVHGGYNGGRACWVIKDSLCGIEFKRECEVCEFYMGVVREEGINFMLLEKLLDRMR
jgi:hypothetical protein